MGGSLRDASFGSDDEVAPFASANRSVRAINVLVYDYEADRLAISGHIEFNDTLRKLPAQIRDQIK